MRAMQKLMFSRQEIMINFVINNIRYSFILLTEIIHKVMLVNLKVQCRIIILEGSMNKWVTTSIHHE